MCMLIRFRCHQRWTNAAQRPRRLEARRGDSAATRRVSITLLTARTSANRISVRGEPARLFVSIQQLAAQRLISGTPVLPGSSVLPAGGSN